MKRQLAIGDIHGGLRALMQVVDRATVTTSDTLIFLGDYVDGWSESAQVIELLIELSARQHCIFLKGNHDDWCEEWLRTGKANDAWVSHGGAATIKSYQTISQKERKQHLHFFEQMKLYYVDENNRLFVHAGFTSMHGPEHEKYATNFMWDRTLWETASSMKDISPDSSLFPKRLKLFEEIYVGHTPTINYNTTIPMHGSNVWNIDTGAAFTGKLTAMDVRTKQFWQSESLVHLYPDEKGRNRD